MGFESIFIRQNNTKSIKTIQPGNKQHSNEGQKTHSRNTLLVKLNCPHNGVSDGSLDFLAFLWEMWKLLQKMSFPASYYSLRGLGFHKTLTILTAIGLCWGGIDLTILGTYREKTLLAKPFCHAPDTAAVQAQQSLWVYCSLPSSAYYVFISVRGCRIGHCSCPGFFIVERKCWKSSDRFRPRTSGFLRDSEAACSAAGSVSDTKLAEFHPETVML